MIVLSDGVTSVTLPADMLWTDRHRWSPVEQAVDRSITGALLVHAVSLAAGRPITLEGADQRAWLSGAVLQTLQAWAAIPGQQLTLQHHGDTHQVIWRHQDVAIEAEGVERLADFDPQDDYRATLRFMTV